MRSNPYDYDYLKVRVVAISDREWDKILQERKEQEERRQYIEFQDGFDNTYGP